MNVFCVCSSLAFPSYSVWNGYLSDHQRTFFSAYVFVWQRTYCFCWSKWNCVMWMDFWMEKITKKLVAEAIIECFKCTQLANSRNNKIVGRCYVTTLLNGSKRLVQVQIYTTQLQAAWLNKQYSHTVQIIIIVIGKINVNSLYSQLKDG